MSWQEAKKKAVEWAERVGFTGDLSGRILLLPAFESEEDCRYFLPDRPWGFHLMIVQAATRTARKAGAKIVQNVVSPKDYRAWLRAEGKGDCAELRQAYITAQTKVV